MVYHIIYYRHWLLWLCFADKRQFCQPANKIRVMKNVLKTLSHRGISFVFDLNFHRLYVKWIYRNVTYHTAVCNSYVIQLISKSVLFTPVLFLLFSSQTKYQEAWICFLLIISKCSYIIFFIFSLPHSQLGLDFFLVLVLLIIIVNNIDSL